MNSDYRIVRLGPGYGVRRFSIENTEETVLESGIASYNVRHAMGAAPPKAICVV